METSTNKCKVQLVNESDGGLFAQAVITDEDYDKVVQRCFDSSRFFALLLQNENGQKAMVGVGFPERNDSFDFIAALEDFKKQLKIVKGTAPSATSGKEKDYSLKEGEKISINIPGMQVKKTEQKPANLLGGAPPSGGLKKLAPPPGAKKTTFPSGGSQLGGMSSVGSTATDALGGLDFGMPPLKQEQQPAFTGFTSEPIQTTT